MKSEAERYYSNHGAVRQQTQPSGQRRAFAHDYREAGTYMVTIVTEGRARLFGHIEGSAVATRRLDKGAWVRDPEAPHMVLSELGRRVLEEEVPRIPHFYPQVEVWRVAMMPDHVHLLLRVKEALPEGKHLGLVVSGFKSGCSQAWWRVLDEVWAADVGQPVGEPTGTVATMAAGKTTDTVVTGVESTGMVMAGEFTGMMVGERAVLAVSAEEASVAFSWVKDGRNDGLMKVARGILRAVVPEGSPSGCGTASLNGEGSFASHVPLRPVSSRYPAHWSMYPLLFSPGYHDRIINRPGMLDNIKRYMLENPLRARIREECPRLMERQLHLRIGGREYAAFGNLFLLKYPLKQQVFFHRRDKATGQPTELTPAYRQEHARLLRLAEEGTVLVTPGISKGESLVVNAALEAGLPLILLQKEPITRYWKPPQRRFYACALGDLLILAPWQLDAEITRRGEVAGYVVGTEEQPVSDFARFHHLNDLAHEICETTEVSILNYSTLRASTR